MTDQITQSHPQEHCCTEKNNNNNNAVPPVLLCQALAKLMCGVGRTLLPDKTLGPALSCIFGYTKH